MSNEKEQFNKVLKEMTELLLQINSSDDQKMKKMTEKLIKQFIELFIASGIRVPQHIVERAKLLVNG